MRHFGVRYGNGHDRVESKSRRGHTSLSRRKKLTVLGDIVTTTEMSKHHHHHKHKQGANQDENKTEDGKTIVPIDPTTDIGKYRAETYVLYH